MTSQPEFPLFAGSPVAMFVQCLITGVVAGLALTAFTSDTFFLALGTILGIVTGAFVAFTIREPDRARAKTG